MRRFRLFFCLLSLYVLNVMKNNLISLSIQKFLEVFGHVAMWKWFPIHMTLDCCPFLNFVPLLYLLYIYFISYVKGQKCRRKNHMTTYYKHIRTYPFLSSPYKICIYFLFLHEFHKIITK